MDDKKIVFKKWRRWSLRKEKKARLEDLKILHAEDPMFKPTLESIKEISLVQNARTETITKVFSAVTTVALGALALFAAYEIDKSDSIPRNRTSQGIFNKLFRF